MSFRIYALMLLFTVLARTHAAEPCYNIDGTQEGRAFEGIGALSAGATSRLLQDYPSKERAVILDYLFKPNYGAALQHLKVEVGGDINSTCGVEPSHMHARDDLNFNRGYEWMLMKAARQRNPQIILDCLPWGAPGWVGQQFSQEMVDYMIKFLQGARDVHGLNIQYIGGANEKGYTPEYFKMLRKSLDANAFKQVKIIAADNWGEHRWDVVKDMLKDKELYDAVDVLGSHYPWGEVTPEMLAMGKPIWSSEEGMWKGTWTGAKTIVKAHHTNYLKGKMTKAIVWSPVTAYYDTLVAPRSGLMLANTPWSGAFEVQPAIWAVAHTTQFAQPGWQCLEGQAAGQLPQGGSYLTYKAPNDQDFSIVIETFDAKASQPFRFNVAGGLAAGTLHVWRSRENDYFQHLEDLNPQAQGAYALTLDPDAIYSITTTTGQHKGEAASPPEKAFPLPYQDDFEDYPAAAMPRYLSDQGGVFETWSRADGQGQCLRQITPGRGIDWMGIYDFLTMFGDQYWRDYELSTDVLLEKEGYALLLARCDGVAAYSQPFQGYRLMVQSNGSWELQKSNLTGTWENKNLQIQLAAGQTSFPVNQWHKLKMRLAGETVTAWINGVQVARVNDSLHVKGMAGIGCGYHEAQFDNVKVKPLWRHTRRVCNVALSAVASASSSASYRNGPDSLIDNDPVFNNMWLAGGKTVGEWVQLDFGHPLPFNRAVLSFPNAHMTGYKLQAWQEGAWRDIAVGQPINIPQGGAPTDIYAGSNLKTAKITIDFAPVKSDKLRVLVTEASGYLAMSELEVYDWPKD